MTYNGLPEQRSGLERRPTRRGTRVPQQASQQYAGHNAGLHDESQPYFSGSLTRKQTHTTSHRQVLPDDLLEEEEEIEDDVWPPLMPSSTRRYTAGYDVSDEEVY
jgi:hypothetical protein